jgi:hypothetical protein
MDHRFHNGEGGADYRSGNALFTEVNGDGLAKK